jgi:ComEC/Rec2-related protein
MRVRTGERVTGSGEAGARHQRGETSDGDERRAFLSAPISPDLLHAPPAIGDEAATPIPAARDESALATARPVDRRRPVLRTLAARLPAALAEEADFGTPFLFVPVLLLAGAAAYFALPTEPARHNLPLALGLAVLLWWLAHRRSRRVGRLVLAAIIVLVGMATAQWHTMARSTQMLGSAVTTHLTGRIVRIETRAEGSVRYTLDVLETARPVLRHVPDRLRVTARSPAGDARVGDGLMGVARLFPLSGPARPGGYDFAFHGYFAGHGANGFFYGAPEPAIVVAPEGVRARLAGHLQNARLWLGGRIRAAAPGEAGAVAAALVNGDKSGIPESVNEALRVSGLAHILTISGLHMALVAGTVMMTLRAVLALSGPLASAHAVKKYAASAAFAAIFVYLFLAGAGVATQRSFIMLAVMLGALMLDRTAISKRNLAIAAIIVIAIAPASVVGPSFHMSFAATLALIALYDGWNRARTARIRRRGDDRPTQGPAALMGSGWRFVAALAATSIVAGAASGLYAAYHFQRVAVLGLVTNLAAMPIVSFLTMPLAILATLAIPFGVDGPIYAAMAASAGWILTIAEWVAARSPDGMVGAMSAGTMLAATAALAWLCLCRTWLRWAAIAPALIAVLLARPEELPVAAISEDGRQVAVIGEDGALRVNRTRPNAFNLEQWQMAYAARSVIKPAAVDDPFAETPDGTGQEGAMRCGDTVCTAMVHRKVGTVRLVILTAPLAAPQDNQSLCDHFDLIVLAYAPSSSECGDDAEVLTAQDLALQGSAEISLEASGAGEPELTVRHAIGPSLRPWHDHRRWSKAARNLADRQ